MDIPELKQIIEAYRQDKETELEAYTTTGYDIKFKPIEFEDN